MSSEIPLSAPQKIRQLQQAQLASGELVLQRGWEFYFPFLRDARYLSSSHHEEINALALPNRIITAAQRAQQELRINGTVTITSSIPTDGESAFIIPSLGIGGASFSQTEVKLFFDPEHEGVVESLIRYGAGQVGHELNHSARRQAGHEAVTLLDTIIMEGLATYYEEHWQGDYVATPWGNALDPKEVQVEWQKAQAELVRTDFDRDAWYFGTDGQHPTWAVYALGRAIIEAYMQQHRKEPMSRLVRRSSEQILQRSGFNFQ